MCPSRRLRRIGKPNVGKSSIINKLIGENRVIVSNVAGTTRDAIDTEIVWNKKPYVFIDSREVMCSTCAFFPRYAGGAETERP